MTNVEARMKIQRILMAEIDRLPSHYDSEVDDLVFDDTNQVDELLELNKIVSEALESNIPKGHWYSYDPERCSVCGLPWNYHMTMNGDDWGYFDPMPNFCPNCGADMRSDDDE